MTWYEWCEQRRRLLIGGMSLIGILALLVCARRNIVSPDSFWHLRMGLDWLVNGLSPWVDHYSFTFAGQEISSPPILFQAALYSLVKMFGLEPGYQIFRATSFLLALGLVMIYLRQVRAPAFVYLIVLPMVAALLELRVLVRPELLSYSLSIAAMMIYYRSGNEVSARTVVPMALLMWFWSNYHSPIFGYIIFFGFFVDAAFHQFASREGVHTWLRWLAWGLVVVGVGALRPGFTHPLQDVLTFSADWRWLIQEYESPMLYRGVASVYALMAITAATLILAVRQRRVGYLAVLVVLIYGASTMARLVTPAGIIIACMFAHLGSQTDWRGWLERSGATARNVSGFLVLLLIALPTWTTATMAREYMAENRRTAEIFPHDVVRYMNGNGQTGRIFNEYQAGGFLIYELTPDSTVYIDGRTQILYPVEHYKRLKLAQASPEVLREEVEKYDISLAVLENSSSNYFVMNEINGFGLDFVGSKYSLYTREQPMLPSFGRLLARPACWDTSFIPGLKSEQINSSIQLEPDSELWPFLGAVMTFAAEDDSADALKTLAESGRQDDNVRRFTAYRALEAGDDGLALAMLGLIEDKQLKDHLAAATAMIRIGALDDAESTLMFVSNTVWPYVEFPDIVIINALLRQLRDERPITMIAESFVAFVNQHIKEANLDDKDYAVTTALFCAADDWQASL